MKLFDFFLVFVCFLVAGASHAQEKIKYPYTAESIRCLIVDNNNHQPLAGKSIQIEKIYYDSANFGYTATVGIHAENDYGTAVSQSKPGTFYQKNEIMELSIQVNPKTQDNLTNPLNMEPFFVDYRYDNFVFDVHDKFQAKCLHRIF